MLFVEQLLSNLIYLLFPILCYFFYIIYSKDLNKKENNIVLDAALFLSLYLTMKYAGHMTNIKPIILFNIPLLIAYLKNKKITAFIISILIVLYYHNKLDFNIYLIGIEYLTYFLLYFYVNKKKLTNYYLLHTFIIIKSFIFSFQSFYSFNIGFNDINIIIQIFIIMVLFYIISYFILIGLKKTEELTSLHISIKKLEKEKELQKSLFMITHEIKNPIAVCKGYLDMFDVNNKEHARKYIPIIKQEIERTLTIMDDFSSFTKMKIEKNILDINLLLEDVLNSLESLLKSNNIKTDFNITDEEIYIEGDYNRLKQVFINVLKNAIESIPYNKLGFIKLRTKNNKNKITIYIEDNGMGMDEETLNRIGQLFYTTKDRGTGLGISLSKEILNKHNASIKYKSKKNIGTTVIINIPYHNKKT
ncbi:MAG: HAMP domain-containing sensor histidine kinase [Bacilli bacterium]